MSVETEETHAADALARPPRRRRRRVVVGAGVVVVLVAAGGAVEHYQPYGVSLAHPLGVRHHANSGSGDNHVATSTAQVVRRSLSSQTTVSGTLGYADEYTVLGQAHGTITALPAVGQVIHQGQVLYRVDGAPVVLLYGSTPVYRSLAEGAEADDVTGADVRQLNADLVALGYASRADLNPSSDEFGWATKAAIKKLQAHLGIEQTGRLDLGQVVFLPTAARVTAVTATLGGQAGGPVLKATSTTRQVSVKLDAGQQSTVKAGDRVTITLPNNQTTAGRVTSVGKVATAGSGSDSGDSDSPTVEVDIAPSRASATGTMDQAPVQVEIITDTVRNALVVPVNALLALAGGGYAVEVVGAGGRHRLVPVSTGLFDDADGLVQVSGADLAAGQRVVVPAS